ncbi:hypothetical protein M408DRAFT_23384 [Serendipita vermifera MAFF 305830]|uniref:Anaphase-promoting complex subunit 4 WD40 domain-containing protein n=1 Tax=Serendipita vermifera MAFF 305830 TaxID=933852 RepID=A0A0C3BB92_SERVB|nr:hypothetical protein M408DRAFT_23384 [Serendipita vermifera MAFF 305830]
MDQASPQFELVAQSPGHPNGTDYDVVSYFPWTLEDYQSFSECRNMDWSNPNVVGMWHGVVKKWIGVAAVCGRNNRQSVIRFVRTSPRNPLQLLHQAEIVTGPTEAVGIRCICWSFDPKTFAPLVVLGGMSGNIIVYSPETRSIFSVLRGHGGRITSLNSHPRNPHIIASTSRDKTARLWCLDLPAEMKISSTDPEANRLGPMFGSPLTGGEKEGLGPGRCFAVTIGGHSDGHNATVLHASFHPEVNILATSGVDHCIKMWSFDLPPPPTAPEAVLVNLVRPIFSTKFLHHAMVSCIHWLSPSLLVSQSAQSQTAEQEPFPAKLVVWKWLAYQTYKNVVTSGYEYVKDSLNATDSRKK